MKLYEVNNVGRADLYRVVSVSEAARLFHRSRHTILYHIRSENVAARMVGRDYIISLDSLKAYFSNQAN